jgi:hypothetical protein
VRLFARVMRTILSWKLRGQTWPHPFFERVTRTPTYQVTVLERDKREALRPR